MKSNKKDVIATINVKKDYVAPKRDPVALLNSLRDLKDGWDGGEGSSIYNKAIDTALDIIKQIEANGIPGPYIFPKLDGGILLEWRSDLNYFTITITREGEIYTYDISSKKRESLEKIAEWAGKVMKDHIKECRDRPSFITQHLNTENSGDKPTDKDLS